MYITYLPPSLQPGQSQDQLQWGGPTSNPRNQQIVWDEIGIIDAYLVSMLNGGR